MDIGTSARPLDLLANSPSPRTQDRHRPIDSVGIVALGRTALKPPVTAAAIRGYYERIGFRVWRTPTLPAFPPLITPPSFLITLLALAAPAAEEDAPAPPAQVAPDHAARMREALTLYRNHVRPLLESRCLDCHGGKETKAGFDLSTREALVESGVIDLENAKDTYFYALISHQEEPTMPLDGERLSDEALERIARWIDLGFPYDGPLSDHAQGGPNDDGLVVTDDHRSFWSFRRLNPVAPPSARDDWERTPIDAFLLEAMRSEGIEPTPEADRRALIRRVTYDLIGLPPTPDEIDAFLNDDRPDAYERLVDRLLASPHYGERWARHWMDVARFAESHGYEQDYDRPDAYHYRDFLIRAFNDDMPFDRFIRWQLAGDEFEPENPLALAATGFLGAGPFPTQLTEAEFEQARYDELDDMVSTTGSAFLGLTVGCARCHDHKFDPIPTVDYYRMAAHFTWTIRGEVPVGETAEGEPRLMQISSEGIPHIKHHADERGYPHFYPETYILERGDVNRKREPAEPGVLRVLTPDRLGWSHWEDEPPTNASTSHRRAALARWITDEEHGAGALAARVAVNRLWHHHFGVGLVATPNDFGLMGDRPSHPVLLDWLAAELIRHDWRLKPIQRLIVTSAAYRQGGLESEADPRRALDPENRLLWHRPPRRLEAEPIRDATLAVAGRLDRRMFGPGTLDEMMTRRSVYFFIKRSQLIPAMMLFDWPEHLVSIGRRAETTTAPQALAFMNSPQVRASAEAFAERLEPVPESEAIENAYTIALGRAPTNEERRLSATFLERQRAAYDSPDREHRAWADLCQTLMSLSEFIYID